MKLLIKKPLEKKDFIPKACKLGLNDMEFSDNYGWDVEFLGELKPLPIEDKEAYLFYLEEVKRTSDGGALRVLNLNDEGEYQTIKRALIYDYNLNENEFEIL